MMISIIIPVYNEELSLMSNAEYFRRLAAEAELIFVDGGSEDDTVRRALAYGEVISTKKGRSFQMNAGARLAKSDILFFLHADTFVAMDTLRRVEDVLRSREYVGGCLSQVIDSPAWVFKWIAWTGNMRARMFKIFYGDQGIFVRRDIFEKIGGFPETPLCEDVLFSRELKITGKVGILRDPIRCSPRRWLRQGIGKTFLLNMRITSHILQGKGLEALAKDYKDVR